VAQVSYTGLILMASASNLLLLLIISMRAHVQVIFWSCGVMMLVFLSIVGVKMVLDKRGAQYEDLKGIYILQNPNILALRKDN